MLCPSGTLKQEGTGSAHWRVGSENRYGPRTVWHGSLPPTLVSLYLNSSATVKLWQRMMPNSLLLIHRGMPQNPKNFPTLSAQNRIIAGENRRLTASKPRAFALAIQTCLLLRRSVRQNCLT